MRADGAVEGLAAARVTRGGVLQSTLLCQCAATDDLLEVRRRVCGLRFRQASRYSIRLLSAAWVTDVSTTRYHNGSRCSAHARDVTEACTTHSLADVIAARAKMPFAVVFVRATHGEHGAASLRCASLIGPSQRWKSTHPARPASSSACSAQFPVRLSSHRCFCRVRERLSLTSPIACVALRVDLAVELSLQRGGARDELRVTAACEQLDAGLHLVAPLFRLSVQGFLSACHALPRHVSQGSATTTRGHSTRFLAAGADGGAQESWLGWRPSSGASSAQLTIAGLGPALQNVWLSHAGLERFSLGELLAAAPNLRTLDLSFNELAQIDAPVSLGGSRLELLNLSYNRLNDLTTARELASRLPAGAALHLGGNAVTLHPLFLRALSDVRQASRHGAAAPPALREADLRLAACAYVLCKCASSAPLLAAVPVATQRTAPLAVAEAWLRGLGKSRRCAFCEDVRSRDGAVRMPLVCVAADQSDMLWTARQLADALSEGAATLRVKHSTDLQLQQLTAQNNLLDDCGFLLLPALRSVRALSLAGNRLGSMLTTRVGGGASLQTLQFLPFLERLDLSENGVTSTDLTELLRSPADGAPVLGALAVLQLSYNHIDDLAPLSCLRPLRELYLNGNTVGMGPPADGKLKVASGGILTAQRSVGVGSPRGVPPSHALAACLMLHARRADNGRSQSILSPLLPAFLPGLAVLDLSSNSITRLDDYRAYTVFALAALQSLDGDAITPEEREEVMSLHDARRSHPQATDTFAAQCQDRFVGALTMERLHARALRPDAVGRGSRARSCAHCARGHAVRRRP
jgi:Leucine-rich repeat (LRR) protein